VLYYLKLRTLAKKNWTFYNESFLFYDFTSREGSLEFEEDEDIIIKLTSIDPQVLLLLCNYSVVEVPNI
jgi:hypothetical protein